MAGQVRAGLASELVGAVVVAGGRGERFGGAVPKQFVPLAGRPLLAWTLEAVARVPEIQALVVVLPAGWPLPDWLGAAPVPGGLGKAGSARAGESWPRTHPCPWAEKLVAVVPGGATRQESVARGVAALVEAVPAVREGWVAVHDGARPLVTVDLFRRVIRAAMQPGAGAAMAALPVNETVKREAPAARAARPGESPGGEEKGEWPRVAGTVERQGLWLAQTPQVCRFRWYERARLLAEEAGVVGSDEAALLEAAGFPVLLVPGERTNLKVTFPEDLQLATLILAEREQEQERERKRGGQGKREREGRQVVQPGEMRVGLGADIHRLVEGRQLVLGGVTVPFEKGLLGHSDADVLTHAIIDACLGAAALGDIGQHFPDHDPRWEGVSSLELLAQVRTWLEAREIRVVNVDAVVFAEKPKLAPYLVAMEEQLARVLGIAREQVSVKAKTGEGLGWIGTGEGMGAQAVVLLGSKEQAGGGSERSDGDEEGQG